MVRPQAHAAWRTICTCCGLILVVLWLGWSSPAALADQAGPTEAYRCDGEPMLATLHSGAVDDLLIPNRSGSILPGAFVVLEWQQQTLQLPRTNNAGSPSFSDGRWWWSLEDADHPDLRQRRGPGDVVTLACRR